MTERNHKFYCNDCFADIESECFCNRIVGYDAETGYAVVDITEDDEGYLYNKKVSEAGDT